MDASSPGPSSPRLTVVILSPGNAVPWLPLPWRGSKWNSWPVLLAQARARLTNSLPFTATER